MTEPNGVAMPQGKPLYQFNGLNSNSSSRGASPAPRVGHIPSSQLPPARASIPSSQLPPARSTLGGITHKVSQLNISGESTPNISPTKFNASTPNQGGVQKPVFSENESPIVPNSMESVPLNNIGSSDIVNRNASLPQSSNVNSLNSNTVSSASQIHSSQTSQYFSQGAPFDMQVNGPLNPKPVQQNIGPKVLPQNSQHNGPPFSQGNLSQTSQVPPATMSAIRNIPQNYFPQQNMPFSQPNAPFTQASQSQSHIGRNTPQNMFPQQPYSVANAIPPSQSGLAQPVKSTTQPLASSNVVGVNQGPPKVLQPNASAPNTVQNASGYSTFPSQVIGGQHTQNKPSYPAVASFPPQSTASVPPTSTNFVQFPQQLSTNQSQPTSAQRPRYPQTLPPNPSTVQSKSQGLPPGPPEFNTGLPPRASPYQTAPGQLNTPPQQLGPSPSQRFDPQINYNVGPTAVGGPLPPPAPSQLNYGAPPSLNGPSTLPPTSQSQIRPGLASNRYPVSPPQPQQQQQMGIQNLGYPNQQREYHPQGGVVQTGFNRLWGAEHIDLLQVPNILPHAKIHPPKVNLGQEQLNQANCSPEVFCCTVAKIPETASLLQKSRLPLGLLIHPFKDLSYLPVIQCNVIVRCRSCRTYINPFVFFVDSKRWKCNLCFRVNELPEEFQYDPVSKTYGDPSRRPEIKSSTIEYIAPAEYMLRPPQPAVYLFLLDVSRLAVESGYLEILCAVLLEELKNLPGDARTQIGFLAYDSTLHFFSLAEGLNQPHEMTILDIDDVFLPTPDNLLVNLKDRMELVEDLLRLLPKRFTNTFDGNSALGAALQVAHKMMGATGGRVSVFQASLPNVGPGAVVAREDPTQRTTAETPLLNPVNDFYKRLALECSGQQVAVDLFIVNSQYVDVATISGISRFSGGSLHHFPLFKSTRPLVVDAFQKDLRRYLTRKIGFEAVMRVRCTRGLAIHTFHGNFFVRSTDLLSLPNINPDAAFGMQVAIEENLSDTQSVCFQAALLYTSSKGERRIRVHTICLPIANTLHDVIHSADQQCIIGLLGKMAVDRSMQASLSDAREAFINAAVDVLSAYKFSLNMGSSTSGLLVPECLKLLPLYISAILKHPAFRIGMPTRLDDRVKAMIDMKTKPLYLLMQQIYPDMYPIHNLELQEVVLNGEEEPVPMPPRLQLSARCLDNKGAFLMDCEDHMMILVGPNISREFLNDGLGVSDYNAITDSMIEIPLLDNLTNQRLHQFINYLNDDKPYNLPIQVLRDNSPNRGVFLEKLIEDRLENSLSYHEFLQHLKTQVK